MFNHLDQNHRGMLLALLGFSSFAVSDVFAKYFSQTYSITQVITISNLFGCLWMMVFLPWLGGVEAMFKIGKPKIHLIRAAVNVSISLTVVYSFTLLPLADVYTFLFAMPFYAALIAIIVYRENVKPSRWLAIIIGFAGILVALRPGFSGFDPNLFWPVLCGVLIAIMFTISKSLHGETLFSLGFWPMMANVVISGCLAFYSGLAPLSLTDMLMFAIHGATIAVGVVGVSNAFRMTTASSVSPVMYIEMIWAIILGYLIFGDVPNLFMMIGAAIIIISGLYLLRSERLHAKLAPVK